MSWQTEIEEQLRELDKQNKELIESLEKLHFWSGAMILVLVLLLIAIVVDFVFLEKGLGRIMGW